MNLEFVLTRANQDKEAKFCERIPEKQTYFPFQGGTIFLNRRGENKAGPLTLGFAFFQQLYLAAR